MRFALLSVVDELKKVDISIMQVRDNSQLGGYVVVYSSCPTMPSAYDDLSIKCKGPRLNTDGSYKQPAPEPCFFQPISPDIMYKKNT